MRRLQSVNKTPAYRYGVKDPILVMNARTHSRNQHNIVNAAHVRDRSFATTGMMASLQETSSMRHPGGQRIAGVSANTSHATTPIFPLRK